jgi:hypothetical protein
MIIPLSQDLLVLFIISLAILVVYCHRKMKLNIQLLLINKISPLSMETYFYMNSITSGKLADFPKTPFNHIKGQVQLKWRDFE